MSPRITPAEALVSLGRLGDPADRAASWRQAIAALGPGVRISGPPPLESVEPAQLVGSTRIALASGLVDELDWIAPGRAAVALYELMSALPQSVEKRELGRRVFARLYEGTASTFAMVATRMAYGAARSLEVPTLAARLGLLFDMPIGSSVSADPLALALVSRSETFQRWVVRAVTGTLPARRLAAKLLERAAREALTRAQHGDHHPQSVLLAAPVEPHLAQLLTDREPLVWRHAAIARGLLAGSDRGIREDVELALDPRLSPTEWRRATVSLVALASVDPETALQQCRSIVAGSLANADPGLLAVMPLGLPPVIEAEPEAAEELLGIICRSARLDVIESVADVLSDCVLPQFGVAASERIQETIRKNLEQADSATRSLLERAALRLVDRSQAGSLEAEVLTALGSYESKGAKAAHDHALVVLGDAQERLDELCTLDASEDGSLSRLVALLGDLDSAALQRARLSQLLLLSRRPNDSDASVPLMESIYERLGSWLLRAEAAPAREGPAALLSRQRRLLALLHLVDLEGARNESDDAPGRVKERVRRAVQLLLRELGAAPEPELLRILCAAAARSLDATVREGIAEPSDVLLAVVHRVHEPARIAAIADASTNPEVRRMLGGYASFLGTLATERPPESGAPPGSASRPEEAILARQMLRLSHALGSGGTLRGESLRVVLLKLGKSLEVLALARGLSEIVEASGASGPSVIGELEGATNAFLELLRGAVRRVLDEAAAALSSVEHGPSLAVLVERAVSDGVRLDSRQMALALRGLTRGLPDPFARTVGRVAKRIHGLPVRGASDTFAIPLEKRRTPLPDWLLPRRTIGGFYVVRALGTGGVSTVFVARRVEERNDAQAELFALKVPEYDASTARSLSEAEFMQMFREEAGALLSLPQHPNLAGFVTFDLGARPKPILVMELISGVGLDRLVRSRGLTTGAAFAYLDGILGGLTAMHGAGLGHLDLKPSNVIIRENEVPVLVDFGLAGRQLRPGCGTLDYCAPEVLGVTPPDHTPAPQAADIYAFGSMAFEVLTATHLFDGDDEVALVTHHVSHDGWPEGLVRLVHTAPFTELATLLAACLRRDPRDRPTAAMVRKALKPVGESLQAERWPVAAGVTGASIPA